MTFKEYVGARKAGLHALGDFIRMARADAALPDIHSWEELQAYIERRGTFQEVEAARQVWADYQAYERAAGRRQTR